jgi:hypothetical protein
MFRTAARLPDSVVRFSPEIDDGFAGFKEQLSSFLVDRFQEWREEIEAVNDFAVNIELCLMNRRVSDPDRI